MNINLLYLILMKTNNSFLIYSFIITGVFLILTSGCMEEDKDEVPIPTTVTVSDIDGNTYKTIQIGTQTWMAENLKTTKYNDGTNIPLVNNNSSWAGLSTPAYCWYDNNISNKNTYGALYNWYTVNSSKLCPSGWHVPSDEEWIELDDYLTKYGYGYEGSGDDIGKSMAATSGWNTSIHEGNVGNDQASNNSSGFTALPGGRRVNDGDFVGIGNSADWWSSTEYPNMNVDKAWSQYIVSFQNYLWRSSNYKKDGLSVRCVKD